MKNIRFECPHCRRVLESAAACAGMTCRCPLCGAQVVVPVPPPEPVADAAGPEQLTRLYRWYLGFGIASLIGSALIFVPLLAMHLAVSAERVRNSSPGEALTLLGPYLLALALFAVVAGLCGIPALVLKCILVYRLWRLVPPERAATTPGRAVGFLFIPLFNLYWNFIAFHELGKFLEAKSGDPQPRQLSLAFAIVSLAAVAASCFSGMLQVVAMILEFVMLAAFLKAVRAWIGRA